MEWPACFFVQSSSRSTPRRPRPLWAFPLLFMLTVATYATPRVLAANLQLCRFCISMALTYPAVKRAIWSRSATRLAAAVNLATR